PTACAQAVVADVRAVEQRTAEAWRGIVSAARHRSQREAERLRACGRHVALATRQGLAAADRDLTRRGERVGDAADGALKHATAGLDRAVGRVEAGGRAHLRTHQQVLAAAAVRLAQRAPRALAAAGRDLDAVEAQVRALDPARALARGWSITRGPDGRVVRSVAALAVGDALVSTLADGQVASTVTADPSALPPDPPRDPLTDPTADPSPPPGSTP
ncbi:MAG: exodeoxyribonuclease VII large subunit, partial [Acidimicrobiales bacterium]|nr:exodeoxyribonuclease VII large subunit [Acidimicrobiales bacterium]